MNLVETIQTALKTGKVIIGYRESIKFIKTNTPKLIVVAENSPAGMRKEIEHNAKVAGVKVEVFNGSSKELGVICGKPFPVTTLVIKG
ncbi:MAG: 50S ribosomal protein L30e [Candidatus Heimdallarchaeota archaeon]